VERTTDANVVGWIRERALDPESVTGWNATGWAAAIWILHAMYETDSLPGGVSHDDVHRIERAAGTLPPLMLGDVDVYEVMKDATIVGSSLGRTGRPGAEWKRLSWHTLAARLKVDPFAIEVPPCIRSFPYDSWPINIQPPAEGSLDREQFQCLVALLERAGRDGPQTECFVYYGPLAGGSWDHDVVYRCSVGELPAVYEFEEASGSPSNIWPADRSWFVYSDGDLWATKVSGDRSLIEAVRRDEGIEAVDLPF
jgi:hypothetical protein